MKKNPGRKERKRKQFAKDREWIKRAAQKNHINQLKKLLPKQDQKG